MQSKTAFLADENFRQRIVDGLRRRQPALDIQTAVQAGLLGNDDQEVLAYSEKHNRVLLTHDAHTMPGELADFLSQARHSPGVLLIPQPTRDR